MKTSQKNCYFRYLQVFFTYLIGSTDRSVALQRFHSCSS